jgi:hypothetical protein
MKNVKTYEWFGKKSVAEKEVERLLKIDFDGPGIDFTKSRFQYIIEYIENDVIYVLVKNDVYDYDTSSWSSENQNVIFFINEDMYENLSQKKLNKLFDKMQKAYEDFHREIDKYNL